MKAGQIRAEVERQLLGQTIGALTKLAQIEALLPHWDNVSEDVRERSMQAFETARGCCNDIVIALEAAAPEEELDR